MRRHPAPFLERAADGVRPGQRDDFAIVEAHAVKDAAEMRRGVGIRAIVVGSLRVGKVTLLRALRRRRGVHASVAHVHLRPARALDGCGARELDEIRPGEVRVLLVELF